MQCCQDEILLASLFLSNATLCVLTVQIGRTLSKCNSSSNFWRFDNELKCMYDWTAVCIFFKDASKERIAIYFTLFLGAQILICMTDTTSMSSLCLICRKKYFCKISDTSAWSTYYIIRILVPTLRYIVFRCDTLYLVGNLFNVQFIQSNTMPSWHNWTNIFDTEIFWPLA